MADTHTQSHDDAVLSRLLDGQGRASDWCSLRDRTSSDPAAWDRVIGSARDNDALGDLVNGVIADTDESTFDIDAMCEQAIPFNREGRRTDRALRASRLGWLVAACLALGLVSVWVRPTVPTGGISAGVNLDALTSSDLMDKYKARATTEGVLVAELPQRTVLESRPTADGKGHEVLYIRQFIERAVVDDVYKLGTDDAGRPVIVPATISTPRSVGAM